MIKFEQARNVVLASANSLGAERVALAHSAGRVLAEDVQSDMDMPPFNKSAMDGYACRRADLAGELTVIETIHAGTSPQKTIGPNQCAKIMTGAPLPEGADCVIMIEFTENPTEGTVRFTGEKTPDNFCIRGEDIKAGQVILACGICIKPQHLALLASVGCVQPLVAKRPTVAVIATGNELVEPTCKPAPSQIRNSNSFQLTAQTEAMGVIATNYGIAADTDHAIDSAFKDAAKANDVVIFSGGVSMGDLDLVPAILRKNNADLLFEKIAIKPGRPTIFAISQNTYCFGLPGNPVSTFVLFELLVKPFLYKLMGCDYSPATISAALEKTISRKKTERDSWMPVSFTPAGTVTTVEYHGSAHINALCCAHGIICIPAGVAEVKKGDPVAVRPI